VNPTSNALPPFVLPRLFFCDTSYYVAIFVFTFVFSSGNLFPSRHARSGDGAFLFAQPLIDLGFPGGLFPPFFGVLLPPWFYVFSAWSGLRRTPAPCRPLVPSGFPPAAVQATKSGASWGTASPSSFFFFGFARPPCARAFGHRLSCIPCFVFPVYSLLTFFFLGGADSACLRFFAF